jgi:NADPH-ferrihemoprotein reductase
VEVIEGETMPHEELHLGNPFHKTASKVGATNSDIVPVSVVAHTELARYAEQDRSCIEVKVDLTPHLQVKYKTGDHIAVWPENSSEEVDTLIRILGLETRRSNPIRINAKSGYDDPKVPNSTTIEALFRHYLEISSPVPRETVLSLARVAPSSVAKKELQAISKDRETYAAFLNANYLTFSRLLAYASSFDSSISWTNLPLSFVIDSLQPMQPRLYSISSSRITSPRQVTLTVSVKPSTLLGKPDILIPGITSSFLSKTAPSDDVAATQSTLQIQIRPSTFKLPINALTPLVMVAAGTGIAPFRAFVQERARLASVGRDVGKMVLFFGCQNESDYLYSQEFQEATSGPLAGKLELVPAFSRAGRKKTYVQDKVHQRQEEVLGLLQDQDAAFYICGAATMAKNVGDVLSEAIKQKNDWPDARAESWRAEKKKGNRWFEDVWS